MGLSLATAPAEEPLTTAEAKLHLRVDGSDDDALIARLVAAARRSAEHETKRALVTQTWDWTLDGFPRWFEVPKPPLQSVDEITYLDDAGAEQTLPTSVYRVDAAREPGRITLGYGQTWPSTYPVASAVTVRFVAGYGAAAAVPEDIKAAMLLTIAHWYRNREAVNVGNIVTEMPMGAKMLIGPHEIRGV